MFHLKILEVRGEVGLADLSAAIPYISRCSRANVHYEHCNGKKNGLAPFISPVVEFEHLELANF